ncbi:DUF5134 domain-containing protein [Actinomycetospora callitridis]|uniref:DUF5134 domain-containing protein n=1 Tax=Actinomycetospora callitridis TaxID=913944 RepID=UPI0023650F8A|nr:DUF5134 domain-containing protein [Actinomycetospora callitridis]MDD7917729.1 DUF5134 domain-containing protein [Actinomycetospora callitridis]
MSLPAPLAGFLATLLLAAAALCAVSLWRRRARHERAAAAAEANHVVMGLGMAAMVFPATADLVPPAAGAIAFGALGVVWAVRLLALRHRGRPLGSPVGGDRCGAHPTHLLLSNAAMAVMYVIMVPTGGMAGTAHGGGHAGHGASAASTPLALSAVATALALYLVVHTVATVAVLVRLRAPATVTVGGGGTGGGPGGGTVGAGSGGAGVGSALGSALGRAVDAPAVQLGCQAVSGAAMALMLLVH